MLAENPFARPPSPVEDHGRRHRRDCWLVWRGQEAGWPLALWRAEAPATRPMLVTDGASRGHVAMPQEFLLYSNDTTPWQVALLRTLAQQVLAGAWMGWGQVLPFPSDAASHRHRFAGLLLSPPFLETPRFEALLDHDEPVHFTMVTPLDDAQFAYGLAAGGSALESALARWGHSFAADTPENSGHR